MNKENWQGKTNYKWVVADGKDFSLQDHAYIILNGVKHFGRIEENFWMYYDEPVWDYTFYPLHQQNVDGILLHDELQGFSGWGYCVFEMPKYTGELD